MLYAISVEGPVRIEFQLNTSGPRAWLHFGLFLDRLSAIMMMLITGVSTIIHIYSINYLQGERGYARFYALLGLWFFSASLGHISWGLVSTQSHQARPVSRNRFLANQSYARLRSLLIVGRRANLASNPNPTASHIALNTSTPAMRLPSDQRA